MINVEKIRIINDFPVAGIKFYDITTLMNDPDAYQNAFEELLEIARALKPDVIVALETRGYFFGPSLALALHIPFVPIRKKGKLPYKTFSQSYDLEYGKDSIEIHQESIKPGSRILIFDDILATGGTATAAIKLVKHFAPASTDVLFLMELGALKGREKLAEANSVNSLLTV